MKIKIVSLSVTHSAGGLFEAVRDLFKCPLFRQDQLNVLSFYEGNVEEDAPTWNPVPIKLFNHTLYNYSPSFRKAMFKDDADILHMEALWRYPMMLMNQWKRVNKKPILCSPHGSLSEYTFSHRSKLRTFFVNLLFKNSLNAVDCYHALTVFEMEQIRKAGFKQPIAVIPNGINFSENTYPKVDDGRMHLLYLGRLHPVKNVENLIIGFSKAKDLNPQVMKDWVLDMVGWGDETFKQRLISLATKLGMSDSIIFHGPKFNQDKEQMYVNSDAYILVSHTEGIAMTALEAWSWKLPIIMTPNCHLPIGFERDAAISVETAAESIAEGIISMANKSAEERLKIGSNGYNLVKEQFTWNSAASKTRELYKWMLGKIDKPEFVHYCNNGK